MARSTGKTSRQSSAKPRKSGSRARAATLGALSFGAVLGAAAAVFGALKLGRHYGLLSPDGGEHVPTDLMGDTHPGPDDRAIDAFRPDPTAPVPAGERDAFRPALAGAAAPTLVKGEARENERLDAAPS